MPFNYFEILDILFLPLIFFLGLITSWEDYRMGKIRNKWIVAGLIFGIVAFLIIIFISGFSDTESFVLPLNYLAKVAYNSLLSLAIGFWLWKIGLISAGDAKLFFIFSFLLPLKYYWGSYLAVFPSFVLAINILMPVFLFILIQAFIFRLRKENQVLDEIRIKDAGIPKKTLAVKLLDYAKLMAVLAGLSLLVQRFSSFISPVLSPYFDTSYIFVGMFFIYRPLRNRMNKYPALPIISTITILAYLAYGYFKPDGSIIEFFTQTIISVFIFTVGFVLLEKFLQSYFSSAAVKLIKPEELKPGMRLAGKKEILASRNLGGELDDYKIARIKDWARREGWKNVRILSQHSFAIWIFLGVVITIILKRSLLSVIIDLI